MTSGRGEIPEVMLDLYAACCYHALTVFANVVFLTNIGKEGSLGLKKEGRRHGGFCATCLISFRYPSLL